MLQKAVEMLAKRKHETDQEVKKLDEDLAHREAGVAEARRRRQELDELSRDLAAALSKLDPKWRAQV